MSWLFLLLSLYWSGFYLVLSSEEALLLRRLQVRRVSRNMSFHVSYPENLVHNRELELIYFITHFSTSFHSIVVVFFPVGLSSLTRHSQQVLWGVEVSSVSWLGQMPVGVQITDYFNCWVSKFLLLLGLGC